MQCEIGAAERLKQGRKIHVGAELTFPSCAPTLPLPKHRAPSPTSPVLPSSPVPPTFPPPPPSSTHSPSQHLVVRLSLSPPHLVVRHPLPTSTFTPSSPPTPPSPHLVVRHLPSVEAEDVVADVGPLICRVGILKLIHLHLIWQVRLNLAHLGQGAGSGEGGGGVSCGSVKAVEGFNWASCRQLEVHLGWGEGSWGGQFALRTTSSSAA